MDSLRTRLTLSEKESTRATVPRTIAQRLLEAYHDRTDTSSTGTPEEVEQLAICVEFEKTVEDAALWSGSFRDARVERGRGKEVLLLWVEMGDEVSLSFVCQNQISSSFIPDGFRGTRRHPHPSVPPRDKPEPRTPPRRLFHHRRARARILRPTAGLGESDTPPDVRRFLGRRGTSDVPVDGE